MEITVRRAERLFQIVQYLRNRHLTTARWLPEKLEVSEEERGPAPFNE